ncbi:MAG: hypothetical protein LBO76_07610, partial [Treponema sp.]|nr:hypothetical protein [Treponema sp.]
MIRFLRLVAPLVVLGSCSRFSRTSVEFQTGLAGSILYAPDRRAASGVLDFSGARSVEFRPDPPLPVPALVSLELEYGTGPGLEFVLSYAASGAPGEAPSFVLPEARVPIRYAVPLEGDTLDALRIGLAGASGGASGAESANGAGASGAALELKSLSLIGRWYGVERDGRGLRMSPFVSAGGPERVDIDVPANFAFPGGADLEIRARGMVRWTAGSFRFERPAGGGFVIPSGVFPGRAHRVLVEGEGITGVRLVPAQYRPFPSPVPLDPAMVLSYPYISWRREDYEVFRWDAFPSLLIFDT